MPMTNWWAARVRKPEDFIKDSYATITLKGVQGIQLVSAKLKSDGSGGPLTAQTYRFNKKKWTPKRAKAWMKKRKKKWILFESENKEMEQFLNERITDFQLDDDSDLGKVLFVTPEILKEAVMAATSTGTNVEKTPGSSMTSMSFNDMWDKMKKRKKKDGEEDGDNGKSDGNMGMVKSMTQKTEQEVVATSTGDDYWPTFVGSYEWLKDLIREALKAEKKYGDYQDIIATFPDKVYFSTYDNMQSKRRYFEIPYELDEEAGEVTLDDPTEIEKKTEWIIKEQAELIAAGLFPIQEGELDEALKGTNDLPDSSFGYIESGGEKDEGGKTTPRSLRHYPMKDADGNFVKGNVVNALTRLNQATKESSPWMTDAAKAKILAMIKKGYKALEMEFPKE